MDYKKEINFFINGILVKIRLLNIEQYKKDSKNWCI